MAPADVVQHEQADCSEPVDWRDSQAAPQADDHSASAAALADLERQALLRVDYPGSRVPQVAGERAHS